MTSQPPSIISGASPDTRTTRTTISPRRRIGLVRSARGPLYEQVNGGQDVQSRIGKRCVCEKSMCRKVSSFNTNNGEAGDRALPHLDFFSPSTVGVAVVNYEDSDFDETG